MANRSYDLGIQALYAGDIDWVANTINVVLVDLADYTPNFATDAALDDIPAPARVATVALASKALLARGVDAADATFTAVTGDPSEALVVYKDTGVEATSTLLFYIDTATGLPVTPGGGNITVTWHANGIHRIPAGT